MAKLEIFNSKANIKDSNTPRSSALALPFSLATQRGAAITDVAKSIASIQKDMYAIEDTNNYNKALPALSLEIDKKYSKYKESRDVDAPNKLIKDLEPSNFKNFLNGQSIPVQRLLKSKLAEKASLLVPKLNSQIVENNIEDFTVGLGESFDIAISQMISKDQAEMAIGTIAFEKLINNKAAAGYIGEKEFQTLVKAKTKIKNNLLLNVNLQVNPKEILQNQEALIEAVGADAAKEYVFKAKTALISKRVDGERKERLIDLQDQETQIGAFTEVLLRIDKFQKNTTDADAKNEMPTINEVYQMYENGIINEAMFVKISDFITEDAQDGMTENEIYMAITTQLHSAKTIQALDDIKKSYITDNNILKNMAMTDINSFNALIDKSKSDFESHRDYKFYSKLINANIRNISTVKGAKGQALSAAIANK
jgi:thiol-disulfide isomerase/thioredoxin